MESSDIQKGARGKKRPKSSVRRDTGAERGEGLINGMIYRTTPTASTEGNRWLSSDPGSNAVLVCHQAAARRPRLPQSTSKVSIAWARRT